MTGAYRLLRYARNDVKAENLFGIMDLFEGFYYFLCFLWHIFLFSVLLVAIMLTLNLFLGAIAMSFDILTISCQSPDAPARFVESLKNTGFALIENSQIEQSAVDEAYRVWGEFFNSNSKDEYAFDDKNTQWSLFPLNCQKQRKDMTKKI